MIEVYRPGVTHVVRGVTCERAIVNEFGFEHLLEEGWFLDEKNCYPEQTEEEVPEKIHENKTIKIVNPIPTIVKIPKIESDLTVDTRLAKIEAIRARRAENKG